MTVGVGDPATSAIPRAESTQALQTPGVLLEQERSRRGLSVQQAAESLHLDSWIIEAIEANRFVALGAPVYAKGYLRKYALMLGLAPDVVIARYDALSDTLPVPTPIPIITTTPPPRPKWPRLVGWTLLAVLLVAIGVVVYRLIPAELTSALDGDSAAVSSAVAPANEAADLAPPTVAVAEPSSTPEPQPSAQSAPQPSAPAAEAVQETQRAILQEGQETARTTVTGATPVRLTLEFSESSWAEVYDAGGERLLYDIGQAGRRRMLSGQAPLTVVIGVASAVSVQVNDQAIVIPRRPNRDSARFVVGADGSVR